MALVGHGWHSRTVFVARPCLHRPGCGVFRLAALRAATDVASASAYLSPLGGRAGLSPGFWIDSTTGYDMRSFDCWPPKVWMIGTELHSKFGQAPYHDESAVSCDSTPPWADARRYEQHTHLGEKCLRMTCLSPVGFPALEQPSTSSSPN